MKKEFTSHRNNELVRVFFSSWEKGVTACEAMRRAADKPCSRFWISSECVRKHVWIVQRHGTRAIRNPMLREMVMEIISRLNGDYSLMNIEKVIEQPAPKFYLRPNTARKIIQRELKRRKQCRLRMS